MQDYVYKMISGMKFGVLSPTHIKKMSFAKIVTPELYDKEGYPVDGGLMDIRLGVIDPGLRCKTCNGKLKECPGHFGYIELARPVVHVNYGKVILDFLRGTCRDCSRVLVAQDKIEPLMLEMDKLDVEEGLDARRARVKQTVDSLKNVKKCPHCSGKQYKIMVEKPTTFMENDKKLSPVEIKTRFEKIPDQDLILLGLNAEFARPEWFLLTILPIPPVTMRPSITLETGERSEDDLTHKLGDIVRINQRLFENINAGAPEIIVEDLWELLQYHVTTYIDNSITQVPPARHRGGQPLKTLTERIKSKEGRFRHNLAGKRVNFAARTVISPDPKIAFNEVGIPKIVAMDLTVPERVTEWNIDWLKEFIKRGPKDYPGANYVLRQDGKKKRISEDTKEQLLAELAPGYIVERHLLDKDIAVFNRQPSLHRMSIMAHRLKIFPGKSFRLNPSVCNPYNADFDGDEMNLHIPQHEEARAEAETLMQVQTQIITPKNGLNVIGCIEDAISGNYLLTKELTYSREEAVAILCAIGLEDIPHFAKGTVEGKEIFSALLPSDFDFIANSDSKYHHDPIIIKAGKLVSGLIDKGTIGGDNGTLIRALYAKYDEDRAIVILSKIFRLGIEILFREGFTSKISDNDMTKEVEAKSEEIVKEAYRKVEELIEVFKKGQLETLPSKTLRETLEIRILSVLNKVRNEIGKLIATQNYKENYTVFMIKSGATGNILNLAQMASTVGQQALRGKRIESGYANRTLSSFRENDLSPMARGFIKKGYKQGLQPVEFFFGAMTGRDSLMDTALRTPKSGYLYRRLANALQDLKVEYDKTVRDANKTIIQMMYGDDDIDVSKSEGGQINIKKIIRNVVGEKDV